MPKRIIAIANNAKWMENCCAAIIVVTNVVVAVAVLLGNLQRVNPFALRVLNLRPD